MALDVGEKTVRVELALGQVLLFKIFRARNKPWSLPSDEAIIFPSRKVKVPDRDIY